MAALEDADVAGDVDGAEPLGDGEAIDGHSEYGCDVGYVGAVTGGRRRREDVGSER